MVKVFGVTGALPQYDVVVDVDHDTETTVVSVWLGKETSPDFDEHTVLVEGKEAGKVQGGFAFLNLAVAEPAKIRLGCPYRDGQSHRLVTR